MSLDSSSDHLFGFNDPTFSNQVLLLVEHNDELESLPSTRVHVSKMLLSARSEYFRSLFGKPFAEKDCEEIEIKLELGETDFMMDLLRFVYSMMCNEELQSTLIGSKSTEEVVRIIVLADRFLFKDAIRACIGTIDNRELSVENCRDLCGILMNPLHELLKKKVCLTMDTTFEKYETNLDDPAITGLPFELFRCMISSDSAKLYSENSVWAAILRWIIKNEPSEEQHVQLLECLRFDHMDEGYIHNFVMPSTYWRHAPDLCTKLCDALRRNNATGGMLESFAKPPNENRGTKDSKEIEIKFDVSSEQLKDMSRDRWVSDRVVWICGIPVRGVVMISDSQKDRSSVHIGPQIMFEMLKIDKGAVRVAMQRDIVVCDNSLDGSSRMHIFGG
eukprot:142539_1